MELNSGDNSKLFEFLGDLQKKFDRLLSMLEESGRNEGRTSGLQELMDPAAIAAMFNETDLNWLNALGKGMISESKYVEAKLIFVGLQEITGHSYYLYVLGAIARLEGKPKDALYYADLVVKHNPERAIGFAERGLVLLELGREEEGEKDLLHALTLDPDREAEIVKYAAAVMKSRSQKSVNFAAEPKK